MFWTFFYYLGAFTTVWLPYKTRCKTGKNWCKSSCHEVPSKILATKAPDPTHWTLNSRFGVFHIIWVHLGQFGCVTTLSVKRVKLVKNIVPRSPIGIFRNERTDPPHWTLNSCFGAFHTIWVHLGLFFALQHSVQNGSTSATVRATKSRWNFSQRTHPIHPIGH